MPVDPWRWQPHPEIWALLIGLTFMYWWAMRRIGPVAAREPGEAVVTKSQVAWFAGALLTLGLASDWPVHDIAEEYLYSVHMGQHLLLSFVVAPMALMATPRWLAKLVIGESNGKAMAVVRRLAKVVPATLIFNGVVVFSHWPLVVNTSASNGLLHYGVHVAVVSSALLMWLPVCGPFPELRFTLPLQMVYLFMQSIIPTVPAGWLTFAEGVVYDSYDIPTRVFGLSVAWDQQIAGLLMKLAGGLFLWTVIAILFVRLAKAHVQSESTGGSAAPEPILTWDQVQRELESAGPAPRER